jgi:hypothetical protein
MSDFSGKINNEMQRELSDDEGSFSNSPGRAGTGKKKAMPRSASSLSTKKGPRAVNKKQGGDHEDDTPIASNVEADVGERLTE